jgi:hypothetical protein
MKTILAIGEKLGLQLREGLPSGRVERNRAVGMRNLPHAVGLCQFRVSRQYMSSKPPFARVA